MLATANTGKKSGEVLEKNAGEWTGMVEISEEEIAGSKLEFRTDGARKLTELANRFQTAYCDLSKLLV